eukprot:1161625-Pelagomonas_calceolata.AAC.3
MKRRNLRGARGQSAISFWEGVGAVCSILPETRLFNYEMGREGGTHSILLYTCLINYEMGREGCERSCLERMSRLPSRAFHLQTAGAHCAAE